MDIVDPLQVLAREVAATLTDPDRKQLRFNNIVEVAKEFYPSCPEEGVLELVMSCDRNHVSLYVKGNPMWLTLSEEYRWLLSSSGPSLR
jgi:hypothetical protein